jgi:hypothetical protein
MKLNNQQLINFVSRIKFSTQDKSPYKDQIENLKTQLDKYLAEYPLDVEIKKTKQAGSWAKGTILKPSINTDLDIDIIFYLKVGQVDENDLHKINTTIVKLLKKIYPTKEDKDFDKSPKTANVIFRTSGLAVDIVPIIEIMDKYPNRRDLEGYVFQPDSKSFIWYITSIDKQLSFISDRKISNPNYASIVRILKKWKAVKELPISSFAIELIVAYLDINKGVVSDISEGLLRAWTFLSQKNSPKIYFDTLTIGEISSTDIVQITDPTNTANNVTKYLSKEDWELVRKEADTALDTICLANEKNYESETLNFWKEILGSEFNIDSLPTQKN